MDILQSAISSLGQTFPTLLTLVTLIMNDDNCPKILFFENFLDSICLSDAIGKVLSLIMLGISFIFKVPVILNILKSKCAKGLNPSAIYMETTAYMAIIRYHYCKADDLDKYGDVCIILIQNLVIILLMWVWGVGKGPLSSNHVSATTFLLGIYTASIFYIGEMNNSNLNSDNSSLNILGINVISYHDIELPYNFQTYLPDDPLKLLVHWSTFITMCSRMPQIMDNFKATSAGVQSSFEKLLATLGCIAKSFVNRLDMTVLMSNMIAAVLNLIIFLQIIILGWSNSKSNSNENKKNKKDKKETKKNK